MVSVTLQKLAFVKEPCLQFDFSNNSIICIHFQGNNLIFCTILATRMQNVADRL